jgi:hypothetical protein
MSLDPVSRLEQAIDLAEMSHNVSLDGIRAAIEQHVAEAVARERDECAAVCQSIEDGENDACGLAWECVAAIRARGTT